MDADEREICIYLKSWMNQWISTREISRRAAGKRRYREDPDWALRPLVRLVERRLIESNATGEYRLVAPHRQPQKPARWVSPQIQAILEKSGDNVFDIKIDESGELDEDFFER